MRVRPLRIAGASSPLRRHRPLLPIQSPQPAAAGALEPRELWIGVHLPELCLEALPDRKLSPRAIVESQQRTPLIVCADEAARRAGVRSGMSAAAALALVPRLHTKTRDLQRERALLGALAQLAQRFTPRVSLAPPDALLLEVRGSLRLFGGPRQLRQTLLDACLGEGVRAQLAVAPTPLAALAGARAGRSFMVLEDARLVGALAPLPLAVLRWPCEVLERLAKVGVRSIGEALRLPRAGFARRFGLAQLTTLDHLVGRRADLRPLFKAPERFRARRVCPYELEQHEAVLGALTRLLEQLAEFLRTRQCGITALHCRLEHRRAPPTHCVLKLAAPQADARHLATLLGEQLARLTLPEPVRACAVRSGRLEPLPLEAQSLWQPGEHGGACGAQSSAFIERLRARLGVAAVHGLSFDRGHRPEALSYKEELGMRSRRETLPSPLPWAAFRRPLWLLCVPRQLAQQQGLPQHRGPLRLLGEPERIESSWWGQEAVARDYYQAVDPGGSQLWVFRERTAPHRWFLHGIFG